MEDVVTTNQSSTPDLRAARPGENFRIQAPGDMSLASVREEIKQQFGYPGHIRAKIGPVQVDASKATARITAIDDGALEGSFDFKLPGTQNGWCWYVGYLKSA